MSDLVFIRAWPRLASTGAESVIRLAGGGSSTPFYLGGEHYRAGVVGRPRFSARLGFDESGWTGRSVPKVSPVVIAPGDAALRDQLLSTVWKRARIEIDAGGDIGTLSRVLTGTVTDASWQDGLFTLTVADQSTLYDRTVLSAPYSGAGGLEGYSGASGKAKRRTWGIVRNVEARLHDPATNLYEVGDHAFPLNAITVVRDIGRAGPVQTIGWQGNAAATLAALNAAAVPQGGALVAPSIARLRWWTEPVLLTCDIEGEVGAGFIKTVPAIASRLVELAGGAAIANLATAIGWRGDDAGLHIGEANESWAAAIDRLTLGASLAWIVDGSGASNLREWAFAVPVETLPAIFVERKSSLPVTRNRSLTWQINHRPMNESEIASVLAYSASSFRLVNVANCEFPAPNSVTKISGGYAWNGKAYIREPMTSGCRLTCVVGGVDVMIGITTDPAVDTDYASIDYTVQSNPNGFYYRWRNGVPSAAGPAWTVGDVLAFENRDGTIHYFLNGAEITAFAHAANAANETLYAVFAIANPSAVVSDITWSSIGAAGASAFSLINVANCEITKPSSVTKMSASGDWDAKAYIREALTGGGQITARLGLNCMIGVTTDPTVDASFISIDYALHRNSSGDLSVRRDGTFITSAGSATATDDLSVRARSGLIEYLKNGSVLYSHAANAPVETLYGVAVAEPLGAVISDIAWSSIGAPGANAVGISLTTDKWVFPFDASGAPIGQSITVKAKRQNTTAQTQYVWKDRAGTVLQSGNATAMAATGYWTRVDDDTLGMTHSSYASLIAGAPSRETFTLEAAVSGISDSITIQKLSDGQILAVLTNYGDNVYADSVGVVPSFSGLGGRMKLIGPGGVEIPAGSITFSVASQTGVTMSFDASGNYAPTAMPTGGRVGVSKLRGVYAGKPYEADYSISKSVQGDPGADGADGVKTFTSESAPTAEKIGDFWVKPSTGELRKWDGSSWGNPISDITSLNSPRLDGPTDVTFSADYTGAINAGQLPRNVNFNRYRGTTDVSSSTTWSVVSQGGITGGTLTISSTGVLNFPTSLSMPAETTITIRSVRDGVTIDMDRKVKKSTASPPNTGGGGGTSVYDTSFNSISSTSFVDISDVMTVKTGAAGTITLTAAAIEATVAPANPTGTFPFESRWRWRPVSGSYTDLAATTGSSPSVTYDSDLAEFFDTAGDLTDNKTVAGLSANANYEVVLQARRTTSGTKTIYFSGTAGAVGS